MHSRLSAGTYQERFHSVSPVGVVDIDTRRRLASLGEPWPDCFPGSALECQWPCLTFILLLNFDGIWLTNFQGIVSTCSQCIVNCYGRVSQLCLCLLNTIKLHVETIGSVREVSMVTFMVAYFVYVLHMWLEFLGFRTRFVTRGSIAMERWYDIFSKEFAGCKES